MYVLVFVHQSSQDKPSKQDKSSSAGNILPIITSGFQREEEIHLRFSTAPRLRDLYLLHRDCWELNQPVTVGFAKSKKQRISSQAVKLARLAPSSMNHGPDNYSTAALHHPLLDHGTLSAGHPCLHGSPLFQKTSSLEDLRWGNTRTTPLRMEDSNMNTERQTHIGGTRDKGGRFMITHLTHRGLPRFDQIQFPAIEDGRAERYMESSGMGMQTRRDLTQIVMDNQFMICSGLESVLTKLSLIQIIAAAGVTIALPKGTSVAESWRYWVELVRSYPLHEIESRGVAIIALSFVMAAVRAILSGLESSPTREPFNPRHHGERLR
ncbi:uncharacterized protein RSE6_09326 [Rhynchosporium secalis]|uniref:Uncharacterized protein n=1 Tax=Rhynchosporium secalis TaxID=38038 RepID=A0A1E1MHM5_RHYSE|nr:uncharacterized protein RSE6_09326 [Rhynchosporium secalis]